MYMQLWYVTFVTAIKLYYQLTVLEDTEINICLNDEKKFLTFDEFI